MARTGTANTPRSVRWRSRSRGAWAFIEDTQGLGVPLDDWCNRVNIDLFSGTVYLSKANTTAFEIDELDEMADEVELNIESELLRIHSAMETWR